MTRRCGDHVVRSFSVPTSTLPIRRRTRLSPPPRFPIYHHFFLFSTLFDHLAITFQASQAYQLTKMSGSKIEKKVKGNVRETVGRTSISKLTHLPEGYSVKTDIYVKLEYLNPATSVYDRIAVAAFEKAQEQGLKQGDTAVVFAGGSEAVSFGMAAASLQVKLVVVYEDRGLESVHKILERLEVQVEKYTGSDHLQHAEKLAKEKGAFFLNSILTEAAEKAHQETCKEIEESLEILKKKEAVVYVPINSGRTVTAINKYFKAKNSDVKVFGVTSKDVIEIGAFLGDDADLEGLKNNGVEIVDVDIKEVIPLTRHLIRKSGLLVGPASGAAVLAAVQGSKNLADGTVVIPLAVDGCRNYLHTLLNDEWLSSKGFNIPKVEQVKPSDDIPENLMDYDPSKLSATWKRGDDNTWGSNSPFKLNPFRPERPLVTKDVLEAIGNTPLVKLNHIPGKYGVKANIYVKLEFMNAGGSVKDRIAQRMIDLVEKTDFPEKLKDGAMFVEPTSGNTGIGLSLASAVKGYDCVIVMPVKMSAEKASVINALGSKIIRTPNEEGFDSPKSHIGVTLRLHREIPTAVVLDQYRNPANVMTHYEQTSLEIIHDLEHMTLDMLVIGAGTGGTMTGTGRRIREQFSGVKIIGVDPEGSILAHKDHTKMAPYEVEGIGYDFIPGTLDRDVVDEWSVVNDQESFDIARDLIALEGILAGGSSGTAVKAAIEAAKDLPATANVVVILPDGIRNYLSKFLDDDWMEKKHFKIDH
ncbi:unnamed protein product [Caenorhabditis auriculariae]|uniref:cystathionine beta-synthase n=1 Tax=Caenorhabditis auriculariae TaxID=2777116 RepID=A0A8S1H0G5_9PELO|nr:unnamed protein product [Caenorhabditis auriculariae]